MMKLQLFCIPIFLVVTNGFLCQQSIAFLPWRQSNDTTSRKTVSCNNKLASFPRRSSLQRGSQQSLAEDVDCHKCAAKANDILTSLFFDGSKSREKFFREDFGNKVVHIQRSTSNNMDSNDLIDFSIENLFETEEFIMLRERGSSEMLNRTKMKTYHDFDAYIQSGRSAVISIADDDNTNSKLSKIKQDLELSFKQKLSMNIYHSGPNGVALNRHYDAYDVFVLQIDGQKEWEIGSHHTTKDKSWTNKTMVPGDVLYLPQGVLHAATTASGFDSTTHVTFGLLG